MSNYMRGWSKRKPYGRSQLRRGDRQQFWSSPVRHLLESLERESALEKPYLNSGNNPRKKHLLPGQGNIARWRAQSAYQIQDKWIVEYNKPVCTLDLRNLDCDTDPRASISIDYAGWQVGNEITYWVGCNRPGLVHFGTWTGSVWQEGSRESTLVSGVSGMQSSNYWSLAVIEGKWLRDISTPFKMECVGGVAYKGAWAKTEIKYGTTIVTQSVLVTANSMTPGSLSVTGTNPVTGARGSSVHTLSELGLDPHLTSLAGHNAVTTAAKMFTAKGNIIGSSFNNYLASRPINELSYSEFSERLDWISTPGQVMGWYPGFLTCPAVEVDVSCNDDKCDRYDTTNTDVATVLRWDGITSAAVIGESDSVTVAITGGVSPYTWSVDQSGFSLSSRETTGQTNTLNSEAGVCGAVTVRITDACGFSCSGGLRVTDNTNWTTESDCGELPATDGSLHAMILTGVVGSYFYVEGWCGYQPECSGCQGDCTPAIVPNNFPPDSICHCEAQEITSWVCV